MDLQLSGKTAIVLGASRGVGKAVASLLAEEGASVGLISRSSEPLRALEASLVASGHKAKAFAQDIADTSGIEPTLQALTELWSAPTIVVVCSAAMFPHQKLQNTDDSALAELLNADLLAPMRWIKRMLPAMMIAKFGRVVMIGSMATTVGHVGAAPYTAGKAAYLGLARALSVDYGRYGITCNVVSPGVIETERLRERLAGNPEQLQRLKQTSISKQLITPQSVAEAVAFLSSPKAWAITGTELCVFAGMDLTLR